jgi:hypothetical protein
VAREARSGDVVITLGAGDVWKLGDRILEHLRASAGAGLPAVQGRGSEAR